MSWETDFVISLGGELGLAKYYKEVVNVVAYLLEVGADIHAVDNEGMTPLMQALAVEGVPLSLIQLLLSKGAKVNGGLKSPLMIALEHSQDERIIRILLKAGATVGRSEGCILSYGICHWYNSDVLKLLIEYLSVAQRSEVQWDSLLLEAIENELDVKSLSLLLEEGASVNLADESGVTPLMKASQHTFNDEVIMLLLKKGADASLKDTEGKTALMHACEVGVWTDTVSALLEAGSLLEDRANNSFSPLMFSMLSAEIPTVQALINYGTEVDAKDESGRTALRILMNNEEPDINIARILLEAGADPLAEDKEQVSALSMATVLECDEDLLDLLEKASKLQRYV